MFASTLIVSVSPVHRMLRQRQVTNIHAQLFSDSVFLTQGRSRYCPCWPGSVDSPGERILQDWSSQLSPSDSELKGYFLYLPYWISHWKWHELGVKDFIVTQSLLD